MKLSEEVKKQIIDILDGEEFKKTQYEGLPEDKRKSLGQFYTPGKLCIQMIEKFDTDNFAGQTVLDPCCGSGNLLIAMLIAGADSDKVFGNEFDEDAVVLCRKRINRCCDILGKPHIRDWQIHQGNALTKECITEFDENYDERILSILKKRREGMHGGWLCNPDKVQRDINGKLISTSYIRQPLSLF